jgi:hypothetical protein
MSEHQNIIMEIQKCPATRMYYQHWGGGENMLGMEIMTAKGGGIGKSWAQLEGSFEIEKYEDALHMTWRVTPPGNFPTDHSNFAQHDTFKIFLMEHPL